MGDAGDAQAAKSLDELGSGAILSGAIASGQVGQFALASGAVNSGQIGSGAVIGSLGSGARTIASGTVGAFDLGSGVAGPTVSGQIITAARYVIDDFSAAGAPLTAAETISGVRAVSITQSGLLQIAMPAVSGRMPAVDGAARGVPLSDVDQNCCR